MNQEPLLGMRILVVDDEPVNVALLDDMLGFAGYTHVVSTTDPRTVLARCREGQPDLILLDLNMPHLDGFAVMKLLAAEFSPADGVPILVLTADITVETKRRALAAGATDFLTKPFDPVEVLLRIGNLLTTRYQHLLLSDQKGLLEKIVRERTGELQETLTRLRDAQGQIIRHERLSALGSMTAGIAHDFNNVLSLILGYSEMLRRSLHRPGGAAAADSLLSTVINAAQDAAKMFGRLREFYRPADKGQPRKLVDLNGLVEQAVTLTRPRWHGQALGDGLTIDVRTRLGADLPPLLADAAELREMLTNLIFNAVDALPRGGTITLRTRSANAGGAERRARAAWCWKWPTRARAWTRKPAAAAWNPSSRPRASRARAWGWRWSTAPCSATAAASNCKAPRAREPLSSFLPARRGAGTGGGGGQPTAPSSPCASWPWTTRKCSAKSSSSTWRRTGTRSRRRWTGARHWRSSAPGQAGRSRSTW